MKGYFIGLLGLSDDRYRTVKRRAGNCAALFHKRNEGALALLIVSVVFGVVYGAYAMFWMAETLPRYYDENRICNFAQGAFHIHIPGVYYNNRNWKHILRAFRVWSMASLVLVPPCTAGAVLFERATGWQVWGVVLVVYIASLFGAIVIPAKRFE